MHTFGARDLGDGEPPINHNVLAASAHYDQSNLFNEEAAELDLWCLLWQRENALSKDGASERMKHEKHD